MVEIASASALPEREELFDWENEQAATMLKG
jgi:hypothetical protein